MINGRNKGHSYERLLAKEFVKLGYDKCVTSRSESKRTDDLGIDLMYTGEWQVQAKALEKCPDYWGILFNKMPILKKKINVIIHKKNRKGEVVVLSKDDFYKIIERLNKK